MGSYKKRFGSVKTIRYCCFVLCWSVLLMTTVFIFGGTQTDLLYDYATDSQEAAAAAATLHSTTMKIPRVEDFELIDSKPKDPRGQFIEMVRAVEKSIPSLPLDFWARQTMIGKSPPSSDCAVLPSILDIEYNNDYWQTQRTSNGTFQLFGAYLDNRKTLPNGDQFVRILGMIDRKEMADQMFCQIWYDQMSASFIVPVDSYKYIWLSGWGNAVDGEYQPYLISCRLPVEMRNSVPAAVSLVENKCDQATNSLRVIYNKPISSDKRQKFAVCVKGLDFLYDDLSVRLVEWIELLSILGADKIYFYDLQVHPNIRKVLDYYVDQGKVDVTKITLPAGKPNMPGLQHLYLKDRISQKRQHELIPYNDCLYKNMYHYEYITLLDIDEVIIPKGDLYDWAELMNVVQGKAAANGSAEFYPSFDFRNTYFLNRFYQKGASVAQYNQEIPEFLHMLRHTSRGQNFSKPGDHAKCFHRSDYVLTLHNHFALDCVTGYCNTYDVEIGDGQLQHYRKDCVTSSERNCTIANTYVEDTTIYKYKSKLIRRSLSALLRLGFVRSKSPRLNAKTESNGGQHNSVLSDGGTGRFDEDN